MKLYVALLALVAAVLVSITDADQPLKSPTHLDIEGPSPLQETLQSDPTYLRRIVRSPDKGGKKPGGRAPGQSRLAIEAATRTNTQRFFDIMTAIQAEMVRVQNLTTCVLSNPAIDRAERMRFLHLVNIRHETAALADRLTAQYGLDGNNPRIRQVQALHLRSLRQVQLREPATVNANTCTITQPNARPLAQQSAQQTPQRSTQPPPQQSAQRSAGLSARQSAAQSARLSAQQGPRRSGQQTTQRRSNDRGGKRPRSH